MESAGAGIPLNPGVAGVQQGRGDPARAARYRRALDVHRRASAGGCGHVLLPGVPVCFLLPALAQREPHVEARPRQTGRQALGAVIVACVVVSALLRSRRGCQLKRRRRSWVWGAGCSLALGLAAVAVQCIQYARQHFGPTNGGYASVFCGLDWAFALAGSDDHVLDRDAGGDRAARPARTGVRAHGDIAEADRLIEPSLDAAVFFWSYLAGIGVVTWVTLYLV